MACRCGMASQAIWEVAVIYIYAGPDGDIVAQLAFSHVVIGWSLMAGAAQDGLIVVVTDCQPGGGDVAAHAGGWVMADRCGMAIGTGG